MRKPWGGNLLIGALLDRLGSAQAQALLARVSESLCQNEPDSYPRTIERRRERRWDAGESDLRRRDEHCKASRTRGLIASRAAD
jgi:hypothetical protein